MATTAIPLATMYDTIGADARNIPAGALKAAGYVTGPSDILWATAAWDRLTVAGRVRVDQSGPGNLYGAGLADVYDVEKYAGTVARFAQAAAVRHDRGEPNCVYGSRDTLEQIAPALADVAGKPAGWWHGTACWLADPSLSMAEASSLVGTEMFGGLLVEAVQWATPTSNPDTVVGTGTLKSLNLDLSVARSGWFPAKDTPDPWQLQALNLAKSVQADGAQLVKLLEAHT
jgi:hypothetical protein